MAQAAAARNMDRKEPEKTRPKLRLLDGKPGPEGLLSMDAFGGERNAFGAGAGKRRLEDLKERAEKLKEEKPKNSEEMAETREPRMNMFRGWSPLLDFV